MFSVFAPAWSAGQRVALDTKSAAEIDLGFQRPMLMSLVPQRPGRKVDGRIPRLQLQALHSLGLSLENVEAVITARAGSMSRILRGFGTTQRCASGSMGPTTSCGTRHRQQRQLLNESR